jgi:hypothetical protein
LRWFNLPHFSGLLILGGYGLALSLQRGHNGMPGQDRAFDAGGKLVNTGENGELSDVAFDATRGHHVVNLIK